MTVICNNPNVIITTVFVLSRIGIVVLSDRGEICYIILKMHNPQFIGYNAIDYFNVVHFNFDFDTSENIYQMIYLFVDVSIPYTLIIHYLSKTL